MPKKNKSKIEEYIIPPYLSDKKVKEAMQELGCTIEEAKNVLCTIKQSKELYIRNKKTGSTFGLSEIREAMDKIGCCAQKAAIVLLTFQYYPDCKSAISYSGIKDLMSKIGCDVEEALEAAITLKDVNMSVSQYPIIKSVKRKIGCSAQEAIVIINARKQLPLKHQHYISYDKIKEAKEAIGCKPKDALIVLDLLFINKYSENYHEIKKTWEALGSSSPKDAVYVLVTLKLLKEQFNVEPSINIGEIPRVMKEINGDVNEATNVLFYLQMKQWPEVLTFSFPDVKTIKELIGEKYNLAMVLDLAMAKQKYTNKVIEHKEWNDLLKKVLKYLNSSQIVQLMKMGWKDKVDLEAKFAKLTIAQGANSSVATATQNKAEKKDQLPNKQKRNKQSF